MHGHRWHIIRRGRLKEYRFYHQWFPRLFLRLGDRLVCSCGRTMVWCKHKKAL